MKTKANIGLAIEHCCECGICDFKSRRLEDGKNFYCPAGHRQYYTQRSKLEDHYKSRIYHYRELKKRGKI